MTEILEAVEKVKFITIKGTREDWGKAFDKNICLGGRDH